MESLIIDYLEVFRQVEFSPEFGIDECRPFNIHYPVVENQCSVETGVTEAILGYQADILGNLQRTCDPDHKCKGTIAYVLDRFGNMDFPVDISAGGKGSGPYGFKSFRQIELAYEGTSPENATFILVSGCPQVLECGRQVELAREGTASLEAVILQSFNTFRNQERTGNVTSGKCPRTYDL